MKAESDKPETASVDLAADAFRLMNRRCPMIRRHTSGQAYVAWKLRGKRRTLYLGVWGSSAAEAVYHQFAASWPKPMLEPAPTRSRREPRLLTYGDTTQTLWAWAKALRLKPGTLAYRLDVLKWPLVRALYTPARPLGKCPRLQHEEASGRAFVRWRHRGKLLVQHLGKWGTAETEVEYQKFVRYWRFTKNQ